MTTSKYRVLYFINGAAPSEAEREDIVQYGPHAVFRNAMFAGGACEPCVAVAGKVPDNYAKRYPAAVTLAGFEAGELPVIEASQEAPGEPEDEGVDFGLPPPPSDPFAPPAATSVKSRRAARNAEWSRNAG